MSSRGKSEEELRGEESSCGQKNDLLRIGEERWRRMLFITPNFSEYSWKQVLFLISSLIYKWSGHNLWLWAGLLTFHGSSFAQFVVMPLSRGEEKHVLPTGISNNTPPFVLKPYFASFEYFGKFLWSFLGVRISFLCKLRVGLTDADWYSCWTFNSLVLQ